MPKSPIAQLLALVEGIDAFTSHDGQAFLRFPVPTTRGFYILPLRSRAFRHWCFYHFHGRHDSLPSPHAFHSLLTLLEARANLHTHGDLQRLVVGRRVTSRAGRLILDLADGDGRFVEISPGSWQVTAGPGVLLETSRSTLPLPQPVPTPAGAPSPLDTLRSCLNLPDRASWLRLLAWMLAVFRPSGPFPFLILQGPPGSGKSLAARILRALVDPATAPLTPVPATPADLLPLARHNWILAFDHISALSPPLADALCRLTSNLGAAFSETPRRDPEPLYQCYRRPVLLTVTQNWSCPPAIAERALTLDLPYLPPPSRRTEAQLIGVITAAYPAILGALCTAVATALQRLPAQTDSPAGRCTDALAWAVAARPALGCTEDEMRQAFDPPALPHPIVAAVRTLLEQRRQWTGTATELADLLAPALAPRSVSHHLRTCTLALADYGIDLKFRRLHEGARTIDLRHDSGDANSPDNPEFASPDFSHSPQPEQTEQVNP